MRIGFLTEYSEERIEFARKAGFESLGIPVMPDTALDIRKLTKKEIEEVSEVFTKTRIEISYLVCSVNHLDPDENKRRENNKYFIDVLKTCRELGTSIVTTNT